MCPKPHVPFEYFKIGYEAAPLVTCAICKEQVHANNVTIGAHDKQDVQRFACIKHLSGRMEWLAGWVSFLLESGNHQSIEKLCGETRIIESRIINNPTSRMLDIALHLPFRLTLGASVIYIQRPERYLSVLKKYWLRLIRSLERERASTLNLERRQLIDALLDRMRDTTFTTHSPDKKPNADIYILDFTVDIATPINAKTIFVYDRPELATLSKLKNNLPQGATLIEYLVETRLPQ